MLVHLYCSHKSISEIAPQLLKRVIKLGDNKGKRIPTRIFPKHVIKLGEGEQRLFLKKSFAEKRLTWSTIIVFSTPKQIF